MSRGQHINELILFISKDIPPFLIINVECMTIRNQNFNIFRYYAVVHGLTAMASEKEILNTFILDQCEEWVSSFLRNRSFKLSDQNKETVTYIVYMCRHKNLLFKSVCNLTGILFTCKDFWVIALFPAEWINALLDFHFRFTKVSFMK